MPKRTRIDYNRKEKRYELIALFTGEILGTMPSGKENKAALERQQLRAEADHNGIDAGAIFDVMARWMDEHPELKYRTFRAGMIVATDGVEPNEEPGRYLVESQSDEGVLYHVRSSGKRFCNCLDYEGGVVGQQFGAPFIEGVPMCKHCLAVEMYRELTRAGAEVTMEEPILPDLDSIPF